MTGESVSSAVQGLIDRACEGAAGARISAVEALALLSERDTAAPFDVLLGFFNSRLAHSGEYRETELGVRNAIVDARYRVARARVAARGLRLPAPARIDDLRDGQVIEPVRIRLWDSVTLFHGAEALHEGLADASPGQEAVFALTWASTEMLLGGVSQLLESSTGIIWTEAVMGAKLVGASTCAEILMAAGAAFPEGRPARDEATRRKQFEALPDGALDALDVRCEAENLDAEITACLAAYVRAHPDEFFA